MSKKNNWISEFNDKLANISNAVFELYAKANAFRIVGLHGVAEELDHLAHAIDTSARGMNQAVSKHVIDEYDASARFSSQNEQAQALRDDGRTVAQIAREMRMTEEQVRILLLDWENE